MSNKLTVTHIIPNTARTKNDSDYNRLTGIQQFCEYGDADTLSPQYTTHISDQFSEIHFARRNLKPNRELRYNHSKLARKKIVPESLHWLQEQ